MSVSWNREEVKRAIDKAASAARGLMEGSGFSDRLL